MLTDANFDELVLSSKQPFLVEFYAPWCGHCKALAPEWVRAANELDGKFALGAVDATQHQHLAQRYGVEVTQPSSTFRQAAKINHQKITKAGEQQATSRRGRWRKWKLLAGNRKSMS